MSRIVIWVLIQVIDTRNLLNPNHNSHTASTPCLLTHITHCSSLISNPFSSMFVQNFFKPKLRAMSLAHLTCPTKSWSSAVTAYRRLHNLYPRTQTRNLLAGFSFSCYASSSSSSSKSSVVVRRSRNAASTFSSPHFYQRNLSYGRFAYDEYASEESDCEVQSSPKQLVNFRLSISIVHQCGNVFFYSYCVFSPFPFSLWEF